MASKRKSLAYRLRHPGTGHHYVIRLGRTAYDKLKETKIMRHNPVLNKHAEYVIEKIKNAK